MYAAGRAGLAPWRASAAFYILNTFSPLTSSRPRCENTRDPTGTPHPLLHLSRTETREGACPEDTRGSPRVYHVGRSRQSSASVKVAKRSVEPTHASARGAHRPATTTRNTDWLHRQLPTVNVPVRCVRYAKAWPDDLHGPWLRRAARPGRLRPSMVASHPDPRQGPQLDDDSSSASDRRRTYV